jgi:thiosulfate reductase cytochrome b subunit
MAPAYPMKPPSRASRQIHPVFVRVTHWINAFAVVVMMMSGWAIYNASPLFAFSFPRWATVGGWLGGSIAWHFAAMWLFAVNGLAYGLYGVWSGHFRSDFFPIRVRALARELWLALTFRLHHRLGAYNSVQRLAYVGVLLIGVAAVVSGLSIWKPVQLDWLCDAVGGYESARRIHFIAMAGMVLFVAIHLLLVAIVPRTLLPMIHAVSRSGTGRS